MNVKLRCDSYDENAIERIEASCPVEYNVYTDGNWVTGADGKSYFRYNLSKIIQNTRVTVYYTNGTSSTVYGKDNIDGCSIIFNDNQNEQHWFPESNPEYTANTVTVRVLNKETQMEIKVVTGALYFVKGKVVNMAGDPVKDAVVAIGDSRLDTTDNDGSFSFYMSSGQYTLTLSGTNAIKRSIPIVISTDNNENNYLDTPFKLCTCDYVSDGYINAKDYAYIMKKYERRPADRCRKRIFSRH